MNAPAKRELAAFLNAEGYSGCHCDFPIDGEDGIIYSLPCRIRDEFGLGACERHATHVRMMDARAAAQEQRRRDHWEGP